MTKKKAEEVLDFGASEFVEFMTDKGIQIKCPCCGKDSFSFDQEVSGTSASILKIRRKNPNIFEGSAAPTVVLYCNNCGYIIQFLRIVIENWWGERK